MKKLSIRGIFGLSLLIILSFSVIGSGVYSSLSVPFQSVSLRRARTTQDLFSSLQAILPSIQRQLSAFQKEIRGKIDLVIREKFDVRKLRVDLQNDIAQKAEEIVSGISSGIDKGILTGFVVAQLTNSTVGAIEQIKTNLRTPIIPPAVAPIIGETLSSIEADRKKTIDNLDNVAQRLKEAALFLPSGSAVSLNSENRTLGGKKDVIVVSLGIDTRGAEVVVLVNGKWNNRIYGDREANEVVYVDEEGKTERAPLSKMDEFRKDMFTLAGAVSEYEAAHPNKVVLAVTPTSNVLWNDWFVTYSEDELYHRLYEPVTAAEAKEFGVEVKYSGIVAWKDGKVTLESGLVIDKDAAGNVKIIKDGEDIRGKINYFTSGQQILKNGEAASLTQISWQWNDLRHILDFPFLLPDKNKGVVQIQFGLAELYREMQTAIVANSGVDYSQIMVNKALRGEPVELDTEDLRGYISSVQGIIPESVSVADMEGALINGGYKKAADSQNIQRGEFWFGASPDKVTVNLKEGVYPHFILGTTETGELKAVYITGRTATEGTTMNEAAELLKSQGITNAILVCNGGDVTLNVAGDIAAKTSIATRDRFSSVMLVTVDRAQYNQTLDWINLFMPFLNPVPKP